MIQLTDILKAHPRPWRYVARPPGDITVLDAANNKVELFTLLDFTVHVTNAMHAGDLRAAAAAAAAAEASPAPQETAAA